MSQRTDFGRSIAAMPARLRGPASVIFTKCNAVTWQCQMNMATWARALGVGVRHARRILAELAAIGAVLVEHRYDRDGSQLCNLVTWLPGLGEVDQAQERQRAAWRQAEAKRLWWARKRIAAAARERTLSTMVAQRTHKLRQTVFGELGMQILQALEGQRGADIISRTIQDSGAIFERFSPSEIMQFGMVSAIEALERARRKS